MAASLVVLGLMSGTSLDGVDSALIVTDGVRVEKTGLACTRPYDGPFRARLRAILGGEGPVAEVERDLTLIHADAVRDLLARAGLKPRDVDAIGFHGHTILHRPDLNRTWQIGDGALLAKLSGIPVVNDFRSADVALGGQGAPLVPVYHRALAPATERPLAVLNLGGVGNVTWIGENDELMAFDTGPGNALIDDWVLAHTGKTMDEDGRLAAEGRVDEKVLAVFLRHPYFQKPPPKSLDRDDFAALTGPPTARLSAADGAATLTAFTAESVALAERYFPVPPVRWLVCGGGRRNPAIMRALQARLPAPVLPVESLGWNGDALEAQAFAFLAARYLAGLPATFPETTGASRPALCGRSHNPGPCRDRPRREIGF